jgi:hypothetical protein
MSTSRFVRRLARLVLAAGIACTLGTAGLIGAPVAMAATVAGAAGHIAGTPAIPPTDISWSVAPSSGKGLDGRSHFSYSGITPGLIVHDYIGISNFSNRPVQFHVYAEDGVTTSDGSIGLQSSQQKSVDIGAWVHADQSFVTVPAHARLNMPFSIAVPRDATPGDHVGGVIASVTQQQQAGKVAREDRVGVAVYLRVNGPLDPTFGIESVSFNGYHGTLNPFAGGWTTVSYTVHNTGNVRLGGSQTITVTGPFGIPVATAHPTVLYELLPGGSVRVKARVDGIIPMGPMGLHVTVAPTPVPGSPSLTSAIRPGTYTIGMWAGPWPQLVVLLVLVGIGLLIWRWLRARRRNRADALAAAVEQSRREAAAELAAVGGGGATPQPESEAAKAESTTDPE